MADVRGMGYSPRGSQRLVLRRREVFLSISSVALRTADGNAAFRGGELDA